METLKLDVRDGLKGKGLFTSVDIQKNDAVLVLEGELRTMWEDDHIDEQLRLNSYRYSDILFLDPGNTFGAFVNHSCNPNARVCKENGVLTLYAIIDIHKDEEITFDYSTILATDDMWEMECECRSIACRKTIASFCTLPKKLKEEYTHKGIVPQYIIDIDNEHIKTEENS